MIARHAHQWENNRYPVAGSLDEYCAVHGYEPIPPGAYRVCGECYHAYATADELVEAYNAQTDRLKAHYEAQGPPTNPGFAGDWTHVSHAEQVYFCPWCSHDF